MSGSASRHNVELFADERLNTVSNQTNLPAGTITSCFLLVNLNGEVGEMVKLNVPLVAQAKNMSCWHASAQMLWFYSQGQTKRAGPMNTLGDKYTANNGVQVEDFIKLGKTVGLMTLPDQDSYTETKLEALLRANGPIWCAGFWFGFGHIVVLTGVDTGKIYFNDPDQGKAKEGTLAWFNEKLAKVAGRMMVKDPARY